MAKAYKKYKKKEKMMKAIRQGDVTVLESTIPPDAIEIQHDGVLAYGETTGHKHQLVGGNVRYFRDGAGELFFEVTSRFVDLNHGGMPSARSDGHSSHRLNQGIYKVLHQREAGWADMMSRDVRD